MPLILKAAPKSITWPLSIQKGENTKQYKIWPGAKPRSLLSSCASAWVMPGCNLQNSLNLFNQSRNTIIYPLRAKVV